MENSTRSPGELGQHPDPKQADDAEAKMKSAPLKTVADLPEDHPIRRRQEMIEHIGGHSDAEGAIALAPAAVVDEDADPDEAAAEAARATLATEAAKAEQTDRAKAVAEPVKKPTEESAVVTEIANQAADDASVLDLSALAGKSVRIKVDGVEQLVPADKVLGQYQKGAAADVRLANATKAEREAKVILDTARAEAAKATTSTQVAAAQTKVASSEAAVAKFKEANEALVIGEVDKSAQLFSEAVALIQTPASPTGQPFDEARMVQEVARGVKAQLSQERALETLFTDYPEIKSHRAYQIVVDEALAAKMANGLDFTTALKEAGEAVAEEYNLGKFKPADVVAKPGRQIKVASGTPTTVDAKRAAKEGLDNVQAGNARVASPEDVVETPQSTIAQMSAARVGARTI